MSFIQWVSWIKKWSDVNKVIEAFEIGFWWDTWKENNHAQSLWMTILFWNAGIGHLQYTHGKENAESSLMQDKYWKQLSMKKTPLSLQTSQKQKHYSLNETKSTVKLIIIEWKGKGKRKRKTTSKVRSDDWICPDHSSISSSLKEQF